MRLLPRSPRRRRRLAWVGGLLGVVGVVAAIVVLVPAPDQDAETKVTPGPALPPEEHQVRPKLDQEHDALQVAAAFLKTAVARHHVADSWTLVTPTLRQGFTRETWARGDIPVTPFPVRLAKWRLDYSYPHELGFQVALFPPEHSQFSATVFNLTVRSIRSGESRHWLVDSFMPGGSLAPRGAQPANSFPDLSARVGGDARLGSTWLMVPVGLLGLGLLLPIGYVIRQGYRTRRAERRYLAGRP